MIASSELRRQTQKSLNASDATPRGPGDVSRQEVGEAKPNPSRTGSLTPLIHPSILEGLIQPQEAPRGPSDLSDLTSRLIKLLEACGGQIQLLTALSPSSIPPKTSRRPPQRLIRPTVTLRHGDAGVGGVAPEVMKSARG